MSRNLTRERIRQIEVLASKAFQKSTSPRLLADLLEGLREAHSRVDDEPYVGSDGIGGGAKQTKTNFYEEKAGPDGADATRARRVRALVE